MKLSFYQVHRLGHHGRKTGFVAALVLFVVASVLGLATSVRQQIELLFTPEFHEVDMKSDVSRPTPVAPSMLEQILGDIPVQFRALVQPYLGQSKAIWMGVVPPTFGGSDARIIPAAGATRLVVVTPPRNADAGFVFVGVLEDVVHQICRHNAGSPA
jgi:hypothetical protein